MECLEGLISSASGSRPGRYPGLSGLRIISVEMSVRLSKAFGETWLRMDGLDYGVANAKMRLKSRVSGDHFNLCIIRQV